VNRDISGLTVAQR